MRPIARLLPSSIRRLAFFLPHWGSALSSVLIVASFPPWDFRFLAWFCLVPWLYSVSRCQSWKQALREGVWMSFGMSVLGFHWVAYVLHQFGNLPWIVSWIGLALYSLAGQPQFLVFAPVYFIARRKSVSFRRATAASGLVLCLGVFCFSLFYAGMDATLPKLFKDTLGHSLYSAPWLRQAADFGGAHFLTFLLFFVNLVIFEIIKTGRFLRTKLLPSAALAILLVSGSTYYGAHREKEVREWMSHPSATIHAGIIQANIGDFEKLAAETGIRGAAERVLSAYFDLSDRALSLDPKPDFLIWPETAYPSTFRKPFTGDDYARDRKVEDFVRDRRFPLLFGSYDRDNGKDFNALFMLAPESLTPDFLNPVHSSGNDLQFYRKNILLMFGEYIPFQDQIPFLGKLFPQVANFGRGIGPDVLQVPIHSRNGPSAVKISPLICYEVLFPDYVIAAARQGSQIIMNITNDSWFGPNGEPHLHLALSVFRSIETRLPLIRATNTGFSALIMPDGEISERTKLFEPQVLNAQVPILEPMPTLIKRWGDWFPQLALWLGLLGIVALPSLRGVLED